MNTKSLLAVTALAFGVAGVAQAQEADAKQFGSQFEGSRLRAEVMAEAATVPAKRNIEPAGARVFAPLRSSVDAQVLRQQAADAVRTGQIVTGETGRI